MLPVTVRVQDGWERSLAEYSRRMLSFRQMDCDYCVWQMLQLCVDPKRVYRTTSYHSNTKQQSARDDPAFLLVLHAHPRSYRLVPRSRLWWPPQPFAARFVCDTHRLPCAWCTLGLFRLVALEQLPA